MSSDRNVIVHYHLFKNAGTSVDQLLKSNFSDRWRGFDGDSAGNVITTDQLERTINEHPETVAFSSHQIVPPLPEIDGKVFPIVFLRDPVDRIKSAYLFEWKKQLGLQEPKGSLAEYVKHKFKNRRKNSVEEFQTMRLSNNRKSEYRKDGMSDEEILSQACEFIATLPFVGIVDQFDKSVACLESYLSNPFPQFKSTSVQANVLQDTSMPLQLKRKKIEDELGSELFEMIVERNVLDEKLYQFGVKHFENIVSEHAGSITSLSKAS